MDGCQNHTIFLEGKVIECVSILEYTAKHIVLTSHVFACEDLHPPICSALQCSIKLKKMHPKNLNGAFYFFFRSHYFGKHFKPKRSKSSGADRVDLKWHFNQKAGKIVVRKTNLEMLKCIFLQRAAEFGLHFIDLA